MVAQPDTASRSIYDFEATDIEGRTAELSEFAGKVLLVVNVASRCGFTSQYSALEEVFRAYRDRGFAVLGFPCNQFGLQEPGTEDEIKHFCSTNYDVTFPLFSKVEVNGEEAHPLFKFLKNACPGALGTEIIKWNFTKFLVGRDGRVVDRYSPATSPEAIRNDIERELERPI